MDGIYYGTSSGLPLGPYGQDELGAQQRAKQLLKCDERNNVYRVEAGSPWEARRKIDSHIRYERKQQRS